MISHFFIDRPIFASVLSIVFVIAGAVALLSLPVAQYPEVTPPTVLVTAYYPGANAETVRDTVAAPIEQQVNGVENMMYMSSQCTNDGMYSLTITFKLGMSSDMAQVLVQNRVSLAEPVIPPLVQREGISVKKMSPSTLMIVNLISPDGRYDDIFPEQLRHHPDQGRTGPLARRGRRGLHGTARLQHARLARSGKALLAGVVGGRRDHGHRRSRTSRSPPGRSASRRRRAASSSN